MGAPITPFMTFLMGEYVRLEQPSFAACYRRARMVAKLHGYAVLSETQARRIAKGLGGRSYIRTGPSAERVR